MDMKLMRALTVLGIVSSVILSHPAVAQNNERLPEVIRAGAVIFIPVMLVEPEDVVEIEFLRAISEFLAPDEELRVEAINAEVTRADSSKIIFRATYSDNRNLGVVRLLARKGVGERHLASLYFASEELSTKDLDIHIPVGYARNLPPVVDSATGAVEAYLGFFTHGPLRNQLPIVWVHRPSPRRQKPRTIPAWVEAEIKIPPGAPGSKIPPAALPIRPRDCRGFDRNGQRTVDGDWVNVGTPRIISSTTCGSISGSGNNTYQIQLCGSAAAQFLGQLGVEIPRPPRGSVNVGGNITIRFEINGCITVTITNTTGRTIEIRCTDSEVNQIKIRDVFCCKNGVPRLCERWVCYRNIIHTTVSIPAFGIVFPPLEVPLLPPGSEPCVRTD